MIIQRLNSVTNSFFTEHMASSAGIFCDLVGKRGPAGGRAQFGVMSFQQLAETIVPCNGGYNKQAKAHWQEKQFALSRLFTERRWPTFKEAIVIAVARKHTVDPKDGFIPLAPGSIDVEAGLHMSESIQGELQVWGTPAPENLKFKEALLRKVGVTTEYGNGDSLELVIPMYTPGIWKGIGDKQNKLNRPLGVIIVTPYQVLYCETRPSQKPWDRLTINTLSLAPETIFSVKVGEAMKIAKQLFLENAVSAN